MNAPATLVSVIIPVFNGEKYLNQCLNSVRYQSHPELEIIVINDGSTDGSERILRDIEKLDSRVIAIHQENGGVSCARNAGLDMARGQWIMFVDSDDMMCDRLLIETVVLAGRGDVDLICFNTSSKDPATADGFGPAESPSEIVAQSRDVTLDATTLAQMIARETLNALWNKAYRRASIRERQCRFTDGIKVGQDLLFNIGYVGVGATARSIPITGYFYRRTNTESTTNRYIRGKYAYLMEVNDHLRRWAAQFGGNQVEGAVNYIRAKNVVSCIRDLHHVDCELSLEEQLATAHQYKSLDPTVDVRGVGAIRRMLGEVYNLLGFRSVFRLTRLLAELR